MKVVAFPVCVLGVAMLVLAIFNTDPVSEEASPRVIVLFLAGFAMMGAGVWIA